MVEPAFRAALVLGGRASPLAALRPRAAGISTVGLPAVAGPAEVEHRLAPRPAARDPVGCDHATTDLDAFAIARPRATLRRGWHARAPMHDPRPGGRQPQRQEQLPEQRERRHRFGLCGLERPDGRDN